MILRFSTTTALIVFCVLVMWADSVVGEEYFSSDDATSRWHGEVSQHELVRGEQFHATLDLTSTIKRLPEGTGYRIIDTLVNRFKTRVVLSYEVVARNTLNATDISLGFYDITRTLPTLEEGAELEFSNKRVPSEGFLMFPAIAEYGSYTLYLRFADIEARVSAVVTDVTRDITEMVDIYFPPAAFDPGLILGEVEVVAASEGSSPPRIIAVFPAQEDDVSVRAEIGATFSEPVDVSLAQDSFTIDPDIPGDFLWQGNTLLFVPSQNLSRHTLYKVIIGEGVRDADGESMMEEVSWRFTTESGDSRFWMVWMAIGITLVVALVYYVNRRTGWINRRPRRRR